MFEFDINGNIFKTKKSFIDAMRSIRDRYEDYQKLSKEDADFMLQSLKYHRHYKEKIGCGVSSMWVQKNESFPTRGFYLERIDGTRTDFSFMECANANLHKKIRDFKSAARRAIIDDIIKFKNKFFQTNSSPICVITGRELTKDTCHVDHEYPITFDIIVNNFISQNNIDVEKVDFDGGDMELQNGFKDKELKNKWIDFHNKTAKLRVISKEANLSL